MKAGARVSFSTSPGSPGRTFGTFVSDEGESVLIAADGTHGVNPVVLVASDRVAEVKEKESFSEHTTRVNNEAREAAKAAAVARQKQSAKPEKAKVTAAAAVIAFLLCLFAHSAQAASGIPTPDPAVAVFTSWTTNQQVSPSYAVVTARSGNGGTPVITYLNAGSDLASSKITFYKVTSQVVVSNGSSSATINVLSTNTGVNWQSGTIIIRHKADDTYEKRTLAANSGAANVVVSVAPMGTMVSGDTLYYAVSAGTVFWGASTNSLTSVGGLISGQQNLPLLIEINGTSNLGLNLVSGFFAAPTAVPRIGL